MTYQPNRGVFPPEAVSLQEKMLRLRQDIVEAQQYRRKLEAASVAGTEKYMADQRISEMESRLTALLDSYGD